jgi:uncharacterized protein
MTEPYLTLDEARTLYARGDAAHDFDHVLRVVHLAEKIGRAEGADATVVRVAALLHDVPTPDALEPGAAPGATHRPTHHLRAAEFAQQFLLGRGMPPAQVENVVHCIQAHRFRDQSVQPRTLEARCLYDADKLDSLGAIGVGRAFAYAGAHGARLWTEPGRALVPDGARPDGADYTPVHEYVYKLQRILATLHTETARRIGVERHDFMARFFERLDAEARGDA